MHKSTQPQVMKVVLMWTSFVVVLLLRENGALASLMVPVSNNPSRPSAQLFPDNNQLLQLAPPVYVARQRPAHNQAIPTNCWWCNWIEKDQKGSKKVFGAWSLPYRMKPEVAQAPYGMELGYPFHYRFYGQRTKAGGKSYYHAMIRDIFISARELANQANFRVTSWDDLGVNWRMGTQQNNMKGYAAQGMAYVTVKVSGLTLSLSSKNAISKLNGKLVSNFRNGVKVGNGLRITFNNKQEWLLLSSVQGLNLKMKGNSELVASSPVTATLRFAVLNNKKPKAAQVAALRKYGGCILKGAEVDARDENSYSFKWTTEGNCNNGYLHFALIHQQETIGNSAQKESAVALMAPSRGPMQAYVTRSRQWTMTDPARWRSVDFLPTRKPSPAEIRAHGLVAQLKKDVDKTDFYFGSPTSMYWSGKWAQKYALLCVLAKERSLNGGNQAPLNKCLSKLKKYMLNLINNKFTYPLKYDTVYRGIVSTAGFVKNFVYEDFGTTVYNDHHFQNGYWITAAAMTKYLMPNWSENSKLDHVIETMIRDVANPNGHRDTFFPKFRSFQWYQGHCNAHGSTPQEEGKDEESSSEDINMHYGLALWGRVSRKPHLEKLGRLMLKLNARVTKHYFLMQNDNKVHPPEFIKNKVVGILFDNKGNYGTWFSDKVEMINGIQMIPPSPVTEMVRTKRFIREEWDMVLSKNNEVRNPQSKSMWISTLYANYAHVNRRAALARLKTCVLDTGYTRTWVLYYALSRA